MKKKSRLSYFLAINVVKVQKLYPSLDLIDAGLISYVRGWDRSKKDVKRFENSVWIDLQHVVDTYPIFGISTYQGISKRLKKLEELNLIKISHREKKRMYIECYDSLENLFSEEV